MRSRLSRLTPRLIIWLSTKVLMFLKLSIISWLSIPSFWHIDCFSTVNTYFLKRLMPTYCFNYRWKSRYRSRINKRIDLLKPSILFSTVDTYFLKPSILIMTIDTHIETESILTSICLDCRDLFAYICVSHIGITLYIQLKPVSVITLV